MKTLNVNKMILLPFLALSACGKYSKQPVSDLPTLREAAKNSTPEKPLIKEVPITHVQVIHDTKSEAKVDSDFLVIIPDAQMNFIEGQKATFKVRARVLVKGLTVKLSAQGLPEGATLTLDPTEADLYNLTWTAPLYTIAATDVVKTIPVKFLAEVASVPAGANAALQGLQKAKDVTLLVLHNQQAPGQLTVEGLNNEVLEGTIVPFSVVATVPGIDGSSIRKPRVQALFDGASLSAGNAFLEMDGSRFITADSQHKEPEYLGDSKWRFYMLFDSKNISVQPQLRRDGTLAPQADGVRVRVSFKVYSPFGSSTPESLKQIKIGFSKPIGAAHFDFSSLGSKSLTLNPGSEAKLQFSVKSLDGKSEVQMNLPTLTSLPGQPSLACQASAKGAIQQDCVLTWAVPCDATASSLKNEIKIAARTTIDGQPTDEESHVLKTIEGKKGSACSVPAKTSVKKEKKP